jgi:hypothetical protein
VLTPFTGVDAWDPPACTPQSTTVLVAQAVPTATSLPCVVGLPAEWGLEDATVQNGEAGFALNAGQDGDLVVAVTLTGTCDTSTARPVSTDETGTQRFDDDAVGSSQGISRRFYRFPGGCVTYGLSPSTRRDPELAALTDSVLAFVPREQVAAYVRETTGLSLCGAGTSCPGG